MESYMLFLIVYIYYVLREQINKVKNWKQFLNESNIPSSDDELYKLAKWSIFEGGYSLYQHLTEDDAIVEIIKDFKGLLNEEFPIGFKNIPQIFKAYRIVSLNNIDNIDKDNLGLHWFTDIERLNGDNFIKQFFNNRNNLYLLQTEISLIDVDIERSLIQRIMSYIENEILLKSDKNIKLISIKPLF